MIPKKIFYCAFTVFLFAMMLSGAAFADAPLITADRNVANGADAFVFEKITVDNQITGVQKLTMFTAGSTPVIINQISSDGNGVFDLNEGVVVGHYGAYYFTSSWDPNAPHINIWYPEITLAAELTSASGTFIYGHNIDKDTVVSFLINAPKVGPAYSAAGTPATARIVFTTPVAGKTTVFGTENFNSETLTASQILAGFTAAGDTAAAGTYTAQAEYVTPVCFATYAKKSNTISFTLQINTLTITAARDAVVRSNPFTVTITGKALTDYRVFLENAADNEVNPTLQPNQGGLVANTNIVLSNSVIGAVFKTDASGKRTIQYNTASSTEEKTYTVRVEALDRSEYDTAKVKVEAGAVTITASGDGSYFIGDEITLSGTNTDSSNVFLFITGQNLMVDGIVLKSLPDKVRASDATNPVAVKTDSTWEFKWDTSQIALDTGAYTIYATSRLTNGKASVAVASSSQYATDGMAVRLSDSEYATISVNLKQPFLSATVIAQGDTLYVRGTAEGKPNNLMLYIFGPNFFESYSVTVEDDGSYERRIDVTMGSNLYFVVVQHPMYNGVFDVLLDSSNPNNMFFYTRGGTGSSFIVWGPNKLQGSQAADALTKMIDSSNIDDTYTKFAFAVTGTSVTPTATTPTIPPPAIPPSSLSGKVTIEASPNAVHIGETISLSGTNTDSNNVFLFITGQNLNMNGISLKDLPLKVDASKAANPVAVKADNTWEYKWDTSQCALDTGTYTIYATDRLTNGRGTISEGDAVSILSANYASAAIELRQPSLTMAPSAYYVQRGDVLSIKGTATGNPGTLTYYLFGPDTYLHETTVVGSDGSYGITIPTNEQWTLNQYFLVIEHPMYNKEYDVIETKTETTTSLSIKSNFGAPAQSSFYVEGTNRLRGVQAADALTKMINSANIDDTYSKYTFIVCDEKPVPNQPTYENADNSPTLSVVKESLIPSGHLKAQDAATGTVNLLIERDISISRLNLNSGLVNPAWSASISDSWRGGQITLPSDMPNYIDGWLISNSPYDIVVNLTAAGTVPDTPGKQISQINVVATSSSDTVLSHYTSAKQLITAADGTEVSATLSLSEGWNFISIPKTLAAGDDTAEKLFTYIDTGNHQILGYDAQTSAWKPVQATEIIKPLTGYWIYAEEPANVMISYTKDPSVPAVKTVYAGWNAVGISANEETDARNAFAGTKWRTAIPWNLNTGTYGTAVISGGTGTSDPAVNPLQPGWGYWLYVEEQGTLTGLTV